MSAKRSYCLGDKPFPVSAKAMRTLRLLADPQDGLNWGDAPQQFDRLFRGGYIREVYILGGLKYAVITDAGRALLERTPATEEPPK